MNTAVAMAQDPILMASAMKKQYYPEERPFWRAECLRKVMVQHLLQKKV
ncbi:MAG: hypothetical protein CM15mP127_12500 [Gammaproteobacteria bacterium]|nr:MAG: hypothetical protein CM15mP127_12500 [Gammaproteobacteria bacterium]